MNDRLYLPAASDVKKIISFKDKKLPSFPQVATKLLQLIKDDKTSVNDISKLVETDPGLSIKVLEIVNSAMYGLRRKITRLSEAITFLGMDEIKKLAFGITVFNRLFKSSKSDAFDRMLFWRHCISVAALSMEIARKTGYPEPEEAYVAGLLHDVGKIFLDIKGKKDYSLFIDSLSESTDQIIEKERNEIGMGHDDIGVFFCAYWNIPKKLILAIKYHHQPFDHLDLNQETKHLAAITAISNFLCWTEGIGSFDFIHPPVLAPGVEEIIGLNKDEIIDCLDKMNTEIDNVSKFYRFEFPSIVQQRKNVIEASLKLSKANTRYYYHEGIHTSVDDKTSMSKLPHDIDIKLAKPLAKAKSVKEVLDIVMYQIGEIFQPQHWSLLLKDQKTGDMTFSVVVGTSQKKLQGIKIPKDEGIVGYIMATGKPLVIENVKNDKRFSPRVDKYTGFSTKSIVAVPLKTDGKLFGVIELINKISGDNFSTQDLKTLSSIGEFAAIAIERSYFNQALSNLATKDPLTGVKNRWSFERTIIDQKKIEKNLGTIFSLLVIAITGLRKLDIEKHPPGSEKILKLLTKVMMKIKRKADDLYRWTEDSFVLILPRTSEEGALNAAKRLSNEVSSITGQYEGLPLKIDVSQHTINAKNSSLIKEMILSTLSDLSDHPEITTESIVSDFDTSLHDMVEEETTKETAELREFGKNVSLLGKYKLVKTGVVGNIIIDRLSMDAIRFTTGNPSSITSNDFLDVDFKLDNSEKNHLKRRVVIREVSGQFVTADFYNPPPHAVDLKRYLAN